MRYHACDEHTDRQWESSAVFSWSWIRNLQIQIKLHLTPREAWRACNTNAISAGFKTMQSTLKAFWRPQNWLSKLNSTSFLGMRSVYFLMLHKSKLWWPIQLGVKTRGHCQLKRVYSEEDACGGKCLWCRRSQCENEQQVIKKRQNEVQPTPRSPLWTISRLVRRPGAHADKNQFRDGGRFYWALMIYANVVQLQ